MLCFGKYSTGRCLGTYLWDPIEFKGTSSIESYLDMSGRVLIPAVVEVTCS